MTVFLKPELTMSDVKIDNADVSVSEKIAVIYLLNAIVQADEKVDEQELNYLAFFAKKHRLNLCEQRFKKQKLDGLCQAIQSDAAKVFAIEQIIRLAMCDGEYHKSERQAAIVLSGMLQLELDTFLAIEQSIIENPDQTLVNC
ncbi:hypothetical protein HR060_14185 [Catenovulum sp. SM1970]|uniref:hypothetical protein n=1 Tax=Marinifaba aquimaris TaxID=2741323 RepID=UPI001574E133|nr:hypothetical protein [Marinifaba aquimaris]NTS78004.1 hypothetical protein [Marinifaba aquimaris]